MGTEYGELGAGTAEHPQPEEKGQRMLVRERCLRGVTQLGGGQGKVSGGPERSGKRLGGDWREGNVKRQRQVEPPAPC